MRARPLSLLVVLAVAVVAIAQSTPPIPRLNTVEPGTGKSGDMVTASGTNLDKSSITELYLTDGKNDIKTPMTEQAETTIKFKIPAQVKAGRYSLMVLTSGTNARLIEQPVKITVE